MGKGTAKKRVTSKWTNISEKGLGPDRWADVEEWGGAVSTRGSRWLPRKTSHIHEKNE